MAAKDRPPKGVFKVMLMYRDMFEWGNLHCVVEVNF